VSTIRSSRRWCSDVLEFTCGNGEFVRIAFALDCRDRKVIGWVLGRHDRRQDSGGDQCPQ
jgi:putative transposase